MRELPGLSGRVHGWGEAFHVRHGSITHVHILGRNHKTVEHEIQTFLRQAAGNASSRRLRAPHVKWIFFILSALFDFGAAILLLDFTYFRWPPPHPIPSIGVIPVITALVACALGVRSIMLFIPSPGAHRFFALLPTLTVAFAALCLWLIWDYPQAHARFEERQVARIKELTKEAAARTAEKRRQTENQ